MPLRGMLDEMFSNLVCKIFRVLGQSSRVSIYLVKLDYLCIRIYNLSGMCIQTLEFIITHDVRNSNISASWNDWIDTIEYIVARLIELA